VAPALFMEQGPQRRCSLEVFNRGATTRPLCHPRLGQETFSIRVPAGGAAPTLQLRRRACACYTRAVVERQVRVSVRVFREPGALLARMAHDVELTLTRVTATDSERHVDVTFEPGSLSVTGALTNGVVDPALLDTSQRQEIERNVRSQVLKTNAFPRGKFEGEFDATRSPVPVRGTLELLGKRQPVSFELVRQGDAFVGALTITPSRWGIAPYRALLGALKLQDTAVIRIEVQAVAASS